MGLFACDYEPSGRNISMSQSIGLRVISMLSDPVFQPGCDEMDHLRMYVTDFRWFFENVLQAPFVVVVDSV